MLRRPQPLRIAIDTGGTFTDCVWAEHGHIRMLKVFSTPADPSQAIVEALQKITHEGALVLLHGTTVGTNTLLESRPPVSKTPSRLAAKIAPSSTTSFSIASSRWSPEISVLASTNAPPATAKFSQRQPKKTYARCISRPLPKNRNPSPFRCSSRSQIRKTNEPSPKP